MGETCSLRDAAKALAVPLTTLRRLVAAEPTLRACIRPAGPRRPAQVDLTRLLAAWQRLQAPSPAAADLSPRQQHTLDRCIRLWWQGCGLGLQASEEAERWVEVSITRQAESDFRRELQQALDHWADRVAPQLPGLPPGEALDVMEREVRQTLVKISSRGDAPQQQAEPAAPPQLAPPDPLPPEDALRAVIEQHRGTLHQLQARAAAGELELADRFRDRAATVALGCRDRFLILPAKLAPLAKGWRNESQARTQLGRAISEVLPPP